jgi:hypothetical protein
MHATGLGVARHVATAAAQAIFFGSGHPCGSIMVVASMPRTLSPRARITCGSYPGIFIVVLLVG